jgi:hypothetical protein
MKAKAKIGSTTTAGVVVAALMLVVPAEAHHSFAMYNTEKVVVMTGVVTRIDPAPNHLQIFFAEMNEERTNVVRNEKGEPIVWAVEMAGSAAMARQGVTVNTFPPRTVISVALHPLRNGEPGGSREGAMFRCPDETPPEPGMHCDSVAGHIAIGEGALPTPSE